MSSKVGGTWARVGQNLFRDDQAKDTCLSPCGCDLTWKAHRTASWSIRALAAAVIVGSC